MKRTIRTIIVILIGIGVWGAAIKIYLRPPPPEPVATKTRARRLPMPAPPPKFGAGFGEFDTYFNEKHELSHKAELVHRLSVSADSGLPTRDGRPSTAPVIGDDYDVTKHVYRIRVPYEYSPSTPHGIVYRIGYGSNMAPPEWGTTLDDRHLIYIAAGGFGRPDWLEAAAALDAIHNLRKQYNVDANRIYLIEYAEESRPIRAKMAYAMADVFSGFVHVNDVQYFRTMRSQNGSRTWEPAFEWPAIDELLASMARPHVFVYEPGNSDKDKIPDFQATLNRDGFTRSLFINLQDSKEMIFPNMPGFFLSRALDFLDGKP